MFVNKNDNLNVDNTITGSVMFVNKNDNLNVDNTITGSVNVRTTTSTLIVQLQGQ